MNDYNDKKILITGLGISGVAAFDALIQIDVLPTVFDDRNIEINEPKLFEKLKAAHTDYYLNGENVPDEPWDFVVKSPGVPPWHPVIEMARRRGAEIIGELELSLRLGRGLYAAITGTNGKTTTTTLAGEIFREAGIKSSVCGNIGRAVVTEAMEADDDTWLVTEVSSFQLDDTKLFNPKIAAFLNITPDHMDRHKTIENYAAAKAKIFANQGPDDFLVYNADDELVTALAKTASSKQFPFSRKQSLETGAYVKDGKLVFSGGAGAKPVAVIDAGELHIPGLHNLENALAAMAVAFAAGISPVHIEKTLKSFRGVEHRLEFVTDIEGVRFVNDSKGTNPDAAVKAIEAVGNGILLIAGGYDKGADFSEYIRLSKCRVKKLLLFGATARKIRQCALEGGFSEDDALMVGGMDEAVTTGFRLAAPGDTILLSPACASWDMYENYEQRGAHFKAAALGLRAGK